MSLRKRPSPAEGEFLFEIDEQPLGECLTALGGVPLLVRTLHSLDVPGNVRRQIAITKRQRGFDEATCVESCVVLQAAGGDCPGGFEALREDPGLAEMLGHEVPSPEAARKFLYQFHDEEAICQAQQQLPLGRVSAIAAENEPLRGLADVNQELDREYEHLWEGGPESLEWAVSAYEESLRRDPASPFRWCDLGEALDRRSHLPRAKYCFERGVELGPNSPPVLLRAAYFHFGAGEQSRALHLTARTLTLVRAYDAVIFGLYSRLEIEIADVLRHGMPKDPEAVQPYFAHLLQAGNGADLTQAWAWMSEHLLRDDSSMSAYVDFLLAARRYDLAKQTLGDYAGERGEAWSSASNLVFNAGFEHDPLPAALDWTIRPSEEFETGRDFEVAATGSSSLSVRFEGQENVDYRHLVQKVVVQPGRYRFRVHIRTEGITTDQGVGFQILAADPSSRLNVETEPLLGTRDWTLLEESFTVPPRTRLLEIRAFRRQSRKFDSKIAGTVWIDDVSLVPRP